MTQTVEAVYERGVLVPVHPLTGIAEHGRVRLIIEPPGTHPLADCIGILPTEDADDMLRVVEAEFEKVEPDAWR